MIRKDYNDQIFRTDIEKQDAIVKKLLNVIKRTTVTYIYFKC